MENPYSYNCKKWAHLFFCVALLSVVILSVALRFTDGYRLALVTSGSMMPALRVNDLVIIKRPGQICVGDIVVYGSGDDHIVHRVVSIDGDRIVTKGDANNAEDDAISKKDVIGVVAGKLESFPKIASDTILAKYRSTAETTAQARVARWQVSALTEDSGTIETTAGADEYGESGYDFTIRTNSETTSEYELTIELYDAANDAAASGVDLGLFVYDRSIDDYILVGESGTGELVVSDELLYGSRAISFRLMAKTTDSDLAGEYTADIKVDITQVD